MPSQPAISRDALPELVERAQELVLLLTPAGVIHYANSSWGSTLGLAPHDLIGTAAADLVEPHWLGGWQDALARVTRGGETVETELVLRGRQGRLIRAGGYLQPTMESDSPATVHVVWRDVTVQTRRERRLQAQCVAADVLTEAETLTDATGRILSRLCQTFGWAEGAYWIIDTEANAMRCGDCWVDAAVTYRIFEQVTRETVFPLGMGLIGQVWQKPEPLWIPNVLEEENFWRAEVALAAGLLSAFCFPVLDRGKVIGIFEFFSAQPEAPDDDLLAVLGTIGRQIGRFSQRIQAQDELARALVDAQAATRAKSAFLANMSHELRTPLNAILGFSKVLKDQVAGELNDKQDRFLQTIHRNGSYLLELIDGILDLSKVEAGLLTLNRDPVSLRATIEEFLPSLALQAESKGITLDAGIRRGLPPVWADPLRLRQICLNLLSNAIKFTPTGGHVTLTVTEEGDKLRMTVTDTGIGISPADQARVFMPFVQIDSSLSRQQAGTGLGLPLTRHLVELHGGELGLQSALGKGSIFSFALPLARTVSPPGEGSR
jgi:PAS domain S-box-containing protein